MQTPTERFMEALSELLPPMTDEQRVRLEDLFYDAVQHVSEAVARYDTRHED
jgi:hypothetical protein